LFIENNVNNLSNHTEKISRNVQDLKNKVEKND